MLSTDSVSFSFLKQVNFIDVPFFQRPYCWERKNWKQLLDDLLDMYKSKNQYFLGSLIIKKQKDNIKLIIDGQQRLTTFSILVKALYDNLVDYEDKQEFKEILYTRGDDKEYRVKLRNSRADYKDFKKVMEATSYEEISEKSKIFDCYKFFSKELKKSDYNNKYAFLKYITNVDVKLFVVIYIDDNDDEQQIFDSINSKGMPLSVADIIKNDLFANLINKYKENFSEEEAKEEAKQFYDKNWANIFENEEKNKVWKNLKLKDNFFYYFALLNFEHKPTKKELSKCYKEHNTLLNKEELENLIKDIKTYAELYQGLDWFDENRLLNFYDYEARLMQIIDVSDYGTLIPIVLKLKTKNLDEVEEKKCFQELEKFIISIWISDSSNKDFNEFVAQNISEIEDYNSLVKVLNNKKINKELLESILKGKKNEFGDIILASKGNKKANLVLFWIELFRNQEKSESYTYSVEHIMPTKYEKHWSGVAENQEQAQELINQIGNLTLITKPLNSSLGNRGRKKKQIEIDRHSSLSISKKFINTDSWGKKEITERTEALIKDFFTIWGI